jgi:uncharacterized Rmd1/YagE family protein
MDGEPKPRSLRKELRARALHVGSRIEARGVDQSETVALAPLVTREGRGFAAVLRFGAVVFFDVGPVEQETFLERLAPRVRNPLPTLESEEAEIEIDPERTERISPDGHLVLHDDSVERLQVVAEVLAKSTVLAHYEERLARVFDRIEKMAEALGRGASPARDRDLLREIGSVLSTQVRMVGRVEISDKPEITWERPELDRLYERLAAEYELRDRDLALSRKLGLVASTAETYLELLQNRRSIRVEWYIVLLIVVEIALTLYEMFVGS